MDEEYGAAASRYFCHMCSLIIRPELGIEEVKCPHCHTGFVEEVAVDSPKCSGVLWWTYPPSSTIHIDAKRFVPVLIAGGEGTVFMVMWS